MIRIDIRPVWRFRHESEGEREFDFQLVALLERIEETSRLTAGAEGAGVSYRHAWNLVAEWERFFGAPLVVKTRGRGTRLTPLGQRLLWAARRAQARLAPDLENLAAEFESSMNASLVDAPSTALVMHASHDFAIGVLREMRGAQGALEVQYKGSFDALAALRRGECDIAGFHLPEGRMGELMARRYAECLPMEVHRFIAFATRVQGLIVRAGNPMDIHSVRDLARDGVRMVNRQRGSGTRALLEFLISTEGLDRALLAGYGDEEITHSAVAALIAGGQADAGFGVQAAAAQYRLGFVPVCSERYYLACRAAEVESSAIRALLETLKDRAFRQRVAQLPGYAARNAGEMVDTLEAGTVPQ
jgi:molybdate transport repressor ModE-like protein